MNWMEITDGKQVSADGFELVVMNDGRWQISGPDGVIDGSLTEAPVPDGYTAEDAEGMFADYIINEYISQAHLTLGRIGLDEAEINDAINNVAEQLLEY